jgi:hypothetical protein
MDYYDVVHPEQFRDYIGDYIGSLGSYGDPNASGPGYATLGVTPDLGTGAGI